jgi:hypothetical protein
MLATANQYGEVEASVPGLAKLAGVSIEATEKALALFNAPDPYSRTRENEGRRISDIDGGWLLLNHAKYRAMASAEHRAEQSRIRGKRFRERHAAQTQDKRGANGTVTEDNASSRQADSEANSEANTDSLGLSLARTRDGDHMPPRLDEVKEYAKEIGLSDWKAVDVFQEMEAIGWLDHNQRRVRSWRPFFRRVHSKWTADGKPSGPPSAAKANPRRKIL